MSVRKKIRKIVIWFFSILLFLILSAVAVSYIYQDKIFKFVTTELGNQINGDVNIDDINLSFLSNFPNISIVLHNVVALSTDNLNKSEFRINADTALVAKTIGLAFNPIDFFRENYVVQKVKIKNARVHFLLNKNGQHNWKFTKKHSDTTVSDSTKTFIELSAIQFEKTEILYIDNASQLTESSYINSATLSGTVTDEGYVFAIETEMRHNTFSIAGDEYLKGIEIETEFNIEQIANKFILTSANITHDGFTLSTTGSITDNKNNIDLDIGFTAKINDIEDFSVLLPTFARIAINNLQLDGTIAVNGAIKGISSPTKNPSFNADITLSKGSIYLNKYTYDFSASGNLASKDISNASQYSFTNNTISVTTGDNSFNGSVNIKNFDNPLVEMQGSYNTKAEVIASLIELEDYTLEGATSGTIYFKGKLSEFNNFNAKFFDRTILKISCNLTDWNISAPADSPYEFSNLQGTLRIEDRDFLVDSLQGVLLNSPFKMQGKMSNFIPALAFENEDAYYKLWLSVDEINADPFVTHYENLPQSESSNSHNGEIDFISKNFTYDIYNFTNASCNIVFQDNEVIIKNAHLKTIDGNFKGNTKVIYNTDGTVSCSGEGEITQASAKSLFKTFNNFDQDFLTENQLAGIINTNFNFDLLLDKDYNPIYPQMKITASFNIIDGTINDFEPFVEMGKKLKVTEFNSVSFKKLENTIKIYQDTLYIPTMDIKTNAFEINIGGKHALNNNFMYNLTIFMQKTLSNRFKDKHNMEDFGDIEQNSDGNLQIPLKIFGNPDKYSIDFDLKASVKNIKDGLQDQKQQWKEILNKPTGDKPKDEPKPIQDGFEYKYD